MGYGLGIDVGTRTVVTVLRQGTEQRVLSQVINPPAGPTPAADAERHAFAIRRALQSAAELTGASPDTVALTYPAGAGPYGFNLVRRAAELARLETVHLVSDIEAAVSHHVSLGGWDNGELLACVDLGDIDYGRPGESPGGDEVTVAILRVSGSSARLVGQARALPIEQSAPAMHAAVSRALRSLLASAGLEPARLSGLLLVGEAVLAPGATGRLAERLVELLGPDLGTTSKVVTAPAHAAALGAAASTARPVAGEPVEDVYRAMAVPSGPDRPGKQPKSIIGFPALPGRAAAAVTPRLGRRWLGAIAACLAAVAVGAGAFVVTDPGAPSSESSVPNVEDALSGPASVTTEETTMTPQPVTTSPRTVARNAERRRTPSTSTSTVHVSAGPATRSGRTSSPPAPSSTTAGVPAPPTHPGATDSSSPPSSSSSSPPGTPDEPHRTHRPWPHHDPQHRPPSRPQH